MASKKRRIQKGRPFYNKCRYVVAEPQRKSVVMVVLFGAPLGLDGAYNQQEVGNPNIENFPSNHEAFDLLGISEVLPSSDELATFSKDSK